MSSFFRHLRSFLEARVFPSFYRVAIYGGGRGWRGGTFSMGLSRRDLGGCKIESSVI